MGRAGNDLSDIAGPDGAFYRRARRRLTVPLPPIFAPLKATVVRLHPQGMQLLQLIEEIDSLRFQVRVAGEGKWQLVSEQTEVSLRDLSKSDAIAAGRREIERVAGSRGGIIAVFEPLGTAWSETSIEEIVVVNDTAAAGALQPLSVWLDREPALSVPNSTIVVGRGGFSYGHLADAGAEAVVAALKAGIELKAQPLFSDYENIKMTPSFSVRINA